LIGSAVGGVSDSSAGGREGEVNVSSNRDDGDRLRLWHEQNITSASAALPRSATNSIGSTRRMSVMAIFLFGKCK
jgi:hypothetical protein